MTAPSPLRPWLPAPGRCRDLSVGGEGAQGAEGGLLKGQRVRTCPAPPRCRLFFKAPHPPMTACRGPGPRGYSCVGAATLVGMGTARFQH